MSDQWSAAQRLLGRWEGSATGRPGNGHQVREYKRILNGRFILGSDTTRWNPTVSEPGGSLHEDVSILSLDRAANQVRMRGFYGEGFVHDYRCSTFSLEPLRFVFETGQVENGPPGMQARETIVLPSDGILESTFELAMPGGEFEPYTHERLERSAT